MALLDHYVRFTALRAYVLVAALLTTLFSLLEFVEQLASVGQGHYHLVDALAYVLLTAPYRLVQVTPVSMLLGSLLALGVLGRSSELTAIRSLGLSEGRIVGAIVSLTVPIVIALFLLAEFVIPSAQRLAQEQRSSALPLLRSEDSFWAQGNNQYLNVQHFIDESIPTNIEIYAFDTEGNLTSFIHADRADIRPDGNWLLTGVTRKRVLSSQFQTDRLSSLSWPSFISEKQTQLLLLPPESMPPIALYRYVRDLEQRHQHAMRYEQELWAKVSFPLSMVSMIMISAPFAFRQSRAKSAGYQIMVGAALGIVFSLSQQIIDHVDLLFDLSPAATALAPSLLLMGVAVYLFRRVHR